VKGEGKNHEANTACAVAPAFGGSTVTPAADLKAIAKVPLAPGDIVGGRRCVTLVPKGVGGYQHEKSV
jgi:hypothetical protein